MSEDNNCNIIKLISVTKKSDGNIIKLVSVTKTCKHAWES